MDGRLDHQRRRQAVAQHRHHLADRRAPRIGRLHQLAHHQLAFARTAGAIGRHLHVALHAAVVGHHEADPGLAAKAADQPVDPVLEHAGDAALAAAAAVDAGHVRQHAVAVHDLAHLGRRQEQIVAATRLRAQEAEALGIGDHRAGDQVGRLQRGEAATAVLDQLPVTDHRAQALAQGIQAVGFGQAQQARQLLSRLRPLGGIEYLQDRFAAGNRVGIAPGLARRMRIVEARSGRGRSANRWCGPGWCRPGRPTRRCGRRRLRHPRRPFRCRLALARGRPGRACLAWLGALACSTRTGLHGARATLAGTAGPLAACATCRLAAAVSVLFHGAILHPGGRGTAHAGAAVAQALTRFPAPRRMRGLTCPGGGIGRRTSFRY